MLISRNFFFYFRPSGNGNRRANNINNSLQRNASGHVNSSANNPPVDYADSSKLMQLYHRRKRQQELQIRSEFNPGDMQLDIMTGKDNSNISMKGNYLEGKNWSHIFFSNISKKKGGHNADDFKMFCQN